jgi:hypothetical protein
MNQVKEFIEYIFNAIKIWIIIQPWQSGVRVRMGKNVKKLDSGMHFRIPYFDSVFVQETRLRVVELPMQTITTSDGKTITLNSAAGYVIANVEKLYKTLYHPETTIRNIIMSAVGEFCYGKELAAIEKKLLEGYVIDKLNEHDYGVKFEYFKIMNFAVVRTYRLIQDTTWSWEGLNLDTKK